MPEAITTPPAPAPVPVPDPTNTPPIPAVPAAPAPPAPAGSEGHPPARPDGVSDAEWSALGDPGKAALVRERAKVTAAEARIREFESRDLTELEKAQREAAENKDAAAKATTEALRWRLAARHGISDEDASLFLVGTDEATLTAQAERVAARLAAPGTPPAPRTPSPDGSQGAQPPTPKSDDDVAYEAIYGSPS